MLKTTAGPVNVHLGPTAFLSDVKVQLAVGDPVTLVGSRVTVDGESFVIARDITTGDQTFPLRDASGRPLWSGARPD